MVLYRVPPRTDSARAAKAAALPTLRASAVIEASGTVTRTDRSSRSRQSAGMTNFRHENVVRELAGRRFMYRCQGLGGL